MNNSNNIVPKSIFIGDNWCLGREARKAICSGVSIFSPEQHMFVAIIEPANHPAGGAKCRRWDFHFFVKRKIIRLDSEIFFAVLANSIFRFHKKLFLRWSDCNNFFWIREHYFKMFKKSLLTQDAIFRMAHI